MIMGMEVPNDNEACGARLWQRAKVPLQTLQLEYKRIVGVDMPDEFIMNWAAQLPLELRPEPQSPSSGP